MNRGRVLLQPSADCQWAIRQSARLRYVRAQNFEVCRWDTEALTSN
jgi:hypothetical protein